MARMPAASPRLSAGRAAADFRYYRLAPSLLEKDKWGNWVINKEYNAAMLAEAVCKLEGFIYAPSDTVYWQHGLLDGAGFHLRHYRRHCDTTSSSSCSDEVGRRSLAPRRVRRVPRHARTVIRTSRSRRFPRPSSPAANGATTTTASQVRKPPEGAALQPGQGAPRIGPGWRSRNAPAGQRHCWSPELPAASAPSRSKSSTECDRDCAATQGTDTQRCTGHHSQRVSYGRPTSSVSSLPSVLLWPPV